MTIRSRAPFTAWLVLLLLMLASVVSFVDRQILAIVVEPIKSDLELSDAEVGWLYGIFAVFYAIAAVPLGFLADRRSRKTIIAVGIGVWSLMTMACGLSKWSTVAGICTTAFADPCSAKCLRLTKRSRD